MKQTATLTTASLLTILFITVHLTGDILFRMSPAGLVNLFAVFFLTVQLYGALVLGGKRAGYIIIFLCSALGLFISVIHMKGTRGVIGGDIGNSGQAFLFVWTTLALGVTATFSIILSARALLSCHGAGVAARQLPHNAGYIEGGHDCDGRDNLSGFNSALVVCFADQAPRLLDELEPQLRGGR